MKHLILWLLYALAVTVYLRFISDTDQSFEMMVVSWIGSAIAFLLVELISFGLKRLAYYQWKREQDASSPSPTTQGCTPEGGVSAYCADDKHNPSDFHSREKIA